MEGFCGAGLALPFETTFVDAGAAPGCDTKMKQARLAVNKLGRILPDPHRGLGKLFGLKWVPEFGIHPYPHLSIIAFIDLLQSTFQPLQFPLPVARYPTNGLRHSCFVGQASGYRGGVRLRRACRQTTEGSNSLSSWLT